MRNRVQKINMNKTNLPKDYLLWALIAFLFLGGLSPLHAVKTNKALPNYKSEETVNKAPAIPEAVVSKFEQKAKNAIIFSAIGVVMLVGVVAVVSLGATSGALPLLGVAALFANIGFIKAMRLRRHTKTRKKTFQKARWRAKTAIILASVLGITLIFGLLSMLLNKTGSF